MFSVGQGVKEYLRKAGTDSVVVKLVPDRIPVCCGGKTRKYYTPYIRPAKPGEQFGSHYEKLASDGVYMFITPYALEAAQGDVTVSLQHAFAAKKLDVAGIPPIIYAD
ncbi:MAG: hypothetical protein Pg6C_11910 [Treponemataceae bacterium]|nr:MAG: hypothetical protein Pg6C_11910 [Treponemataceae bacterium]